RLASIAGRPGADADRTGRNLMRMMSPRASRCEQLEAGHLEVPDGKRRTHARRTTGRSIIEPSRALWTRLARATTPRVTAGTRFLLCPPRPTRDPDLHVHSCDRNGTRTV